MCFMISKFFMLVMVPKLFGDLSEDQFPSELSELRLHSAKIIGWGFLDILLLMLFSGFLHQSWTVRIPDWLVIFL